MRNGRKRSMAINKKGFGRILSTDFGTGRDEHKEQKGVTEDRSVIR